MSTEPSQRSVVSDSAERPCQSHGRAWEGNRLRRARAFGEAMRPWWVESGHPLPKSPRQKWIETKESWERSRHIEVPAPVPAASGTGRGFLPLARDLVPQGCGGRFLLLSDEKPRGPPV